MSPPSIDFNVLVGAETGILKGVNVNPKANIVKNFHAGTSTISAGGKLSKDDEITCLSWNGDSQSELLLALRNRTVRVFDVAEKSFVETIDLRKHEDEKGEDIIRGIGRWDDTIITASKSGTVKPWRYDQVGQTRPELIINLCECQWYNWCYELRLHFRRDRSKLSSTPFTLTWGSRES